MVALLVLGSPCAGALTDLVQVKSMDSITANTSSAATTKVTKETGAAGAGTAAGAAATAAYPPGKEWKADAQKQFKKYSVAMLKERDWLRYKAFKRRERAFASGRGDVWCACVTLAPCTFYSEPEPRKAGAQIRVVP